MRTHTTSSYKSQTQNYESCGQPEPPDLLDLDDEIIGPFWQSRTVEPTDDIVARWAIIHAYETGAIGAVEAFYALDARALFGDLSDFMDAYCAGIRALSASSTKP